MRFFVRVLPMSLCPTCLPTSPSPPTLPPWLCHPQSYSPQDPTSNLAVALALALALSPLPLSPLPLSLLRLSLSPLPLSPLPLSPLLLSPLPLSPLPLSPLPLSHLLLGCPRRWLCCYRAPFVDICKPLPK